jgi:hypothetical protein
MGLKKNFLKAFLQKKKKDTHEGTKKIIENALAPKPPIQF